ncbi:hypothetical protein C439_06310 [Haloferax mediterranei ATCC 33500]|uniref:Uncharacterized protein n=1 Tax=Haloferax mediterranei (strain ATCC 33500 / DSM 1411 / JCM 8866 / NBRC 14739 / NCIMB 2177 / R-4) TaxID=523841 RepID=M0IZN3_HALMT|nr:hypothetical protein BM92_05070 [Haloferax mediterranei ATCC 33500]EMA02171.1 hypothetical protein C439_06310 [Haloferax mediterranei ATCC 33500]
MLDGEVAVGVGRELYVVVFDEFERTSHQLVHDLHASIELFDVVLGVSTYTGCVLPTVETVASGTMRHKHQVDISGGQGAEIDGQTPLSVLWTM